MIPYLPSTARQPVTAGRWALFVLVLGASGCSQPNGFTRRHSQIAALRESVNQLESEKSRLERQVAELSSENRYLEDRLVREEARSAELARRLDDSRRMGRSRNRSDLEDTSTARREIDLDWDDAPPRSTSPRPSRARRIPVAQIPGEIEPLPERRPADTFGPHGRSTPPEDEPAESDLFPSSVDVGARSDRDQGRWLPVARRRGPTVR